MRTVVLVCFALAFPTWSLPVEQRLWKSPFSIGGNTDPEIDMTPDQLIEYWGYPAEQYSVVTDDGYILPVYRIPRGKGEAPSTTKKPVVFLQHGLENSAADWVINLPSESAAFVFADAGFDVFIGNFRGTTYSMHHTTLSSKDHKFWQFSWDEMAKYDLPAMINKSLEISGASQLYFVAHSMGTMTGFAQFSSDQDFAKKIKHFYALGPVVNMQHVKGPAKIGAPFTKSASFIATVFGIDEFLPNTKLQHILAKHCPYPLTDILCQNVLVMISGPTGQMNVSRLPVIDSHSPAGTSVQNVVHFGQLINTGLFQAYDYGSAKDNQAKYGTDRPPIYDVKNMNVPISIYYGGNDWLAPPEDVLTAIQEFPHVADTLYLADFNHMDFAWGIKAASLVYQPIAKAISDDFKA